MNLNNPLARWVERCGGSPVVPLMGYPGVQITQSSVKQNLFNWGLQFWTLSELTKRYRPDAIFTLMDLSVEANALGLPVRYPLHDLPSVEYTVVAEESDLLQFQALDLLKDGRVQVFIETVKLMKSALDTTVGAYVIGPFTLAGLMMGASEAAITTLDDERLMHAVLRFCTKVITRYAHALEVAGADMIAVLEPTAVMLSPEAFAAFSAPYLQRIKRSVEAPIILHICGDTTRLIPEMIKTGVDGLSLDALVDFPVIAAQVPEETFLFGNVDPVTVMSHGTPEKVEQAVRELLTGMHDRHSFVLSTGCDLPPETPLANIDAFMRAGRG